MELTESGIKLLFSACFSHLTTPSCTVQTTTKTHRNSTPQSDTAM